MESKENRPKQVIVIRKDLNMRRGKQISQGAHSSFKTFLDLCDKFECGNKAEIVFHYKKETAWDYWLNGIFTKIVVGCENEKELLDLYQQAIDSSLPCSLIVDAGLTEFNGTPTKTCIAIGPAYSEDIDKITGNLKLL